MLYILNTLVVPINFDVVGEAVVELKRISLEEARRIVSKSRWESAVGHEGSAVILSELLGVEIPVERKAVFLKKGDRGLHFFLKKRLPEGTVLSAEELRKLDFWLVLSFVR
jgi:hypothetical protein